MVARRAALASSATARAKASTTATSVPGERDSRCTSSNSRGARRIPTPVVTTRKPTAAATTPNTVSADTEPADTIRTTTVRITRPSTSSATAAPSTVRASTLDSARRSPKTRAVMPTEVAVSAAPMMSAGWPPSPRICITP